jgi:hypothetical protein
MQIGNMTMPNGSAQNMLGLVAIVDMVSIDSFDHLLLCA